MIQARSTELGDPLGIFIAQDDGKQKTMTCGDEADVSNSSCDTLTCCDMQLPNYPSYCMYSYILFNFLVVGSQLFEAIIIF